MPNRLAHESSPYLLQHANNPVDWYPWGEEALALAKQLDKPIFLSIGYSACHWCHVMEHESFEDARIAQLMNDNFVCIKVDREERPDLDQIYMTAVQLLTQRGGWPMSVFLTPDLQPFYGGTYWPPTARGGMPGFDQVLTGLAQVWRDRRTEALSQAASLTEHIRSIAAAEVAPSQPNAELLDRAAAALERSFDQQHGGFGGAPKFPHPMDLRLLLRIWRRTNQPQLLQMVTHTLDKMARGGMYDQLGGGFHRYSVDARWLVPHFEKMLYDNALLLPAYLEGYLVTGDVEFARVAREIAEYVLREMTDPAGGFYSTQDADSEGEEGKFFVWTPAEVSHVLGEERARTFCYVYDISDEGNFEGHNIPNLPKTVDQCAKMLGRDEAELAEELAISRSLLFAVRLQRIAPGRDDKVLVAWNGLMIDALAQAAGVLNEPRYGQAAEHAARFTTDKLRDANGRLLHTWRGGTAKLSAYLDDYAALANGLVSLYEATFDEAWITAACELCETMLAHFADTEGGFFYIADDHEALIARQKDLFDNATPSGNSLAATVLSRLAKLTGRSDFAQAAEATFRTATAMVEQSPTAAGQLLIALDFWLGPAKEIAIVGSTDHPTTQAVLAALRQQFSPNKVVALRAPAAPSGPLDELFRDRTLQGEEPTVYVCENFTCAAPMLGHEAVTRLSNGHSFSPSPLAGEGAGG
jgi:uncharacterized protein YyaL (SSP411 family)